MMKLIDHHETEYHFALHLLPMRRPLPQIDQTIDSPAKDDFGNVHTFDGIGSIVAIESTDEGWEKSLTAYVRIFPIIK